MLGSAQRAGACLGPRDARRLLQCTAWRCNGGTMATIGVSEAARMVGRDVSTLHRMMKSGRLSYTTDSSGRRRLDPAELGRLFEISSMHGNGATHSMDSRQAQSGDAMQVVALQRERDLLLDQVTDLRRRLDLEAEERRRLTAVLTDRRGRTEEQPPSWPRRVARWLVKQHV
jgi:hypothetical protein